MVATDSTCAEPKVPLLWNKFHCVESEFDCAVRCQGNTPMFVYGKPCADSRTYDCRCEIQILLCSNIHLNLSFSRAPPTQFFHYFNELMLLTRYVTFIYFFTVLFITDSQTDRYTDRGSSVCCS